MGINGFPVNFNPAQTQLFDPKTGALTNSGLRFLLQIFNRTGAGNGFPTVADNLTAEGTTQQTALLLAADWNFVTSTPSGSGVVFPPMQQGADIIVWNFDGAQALDVYPSPATPAIQIDALGNNQPYSLAHGKMQWFRQRSPTLIVSTQLG